MKTVKIMGFLGKINLMIFSIIFYCILSIVTLMISIIDR